MSSKEADRQDRLLRSLVYAGLTTLRTSPFTSPLFSKVFDIF